MNEIATIIVSIGGVLFSILLMCGIFSDEISNVIHAIRGDEDGEE